MGTQFAVIYDVIIIAVIAGMTFAGAKKGFASVIVGFVAVFVAFFCAMSFSEPITDAIYRSAVEQPLETAVDEQLDAVMGKATLSGMSHVDYEMVMISGQHASVYPIDYAGTNKAVVDLSDMDLSRTGISSADLSLFGIPADTDFSSVSGKTAEFTMAEVEQYGLGKLAVAQYLAVNAQSSEFFAGFLDYTDKIGNAVPFVFGDISNSISGGSVPALRNIVIKMADGSASAKDAVINGVIEPYFKMAVKTTLFVVIFLVVSVLLGVLAAALKAVNKIPVLGSFNAFVGGVAGLLEGLITVFIICIGVRLLVSLSNGNIMFFNEMTINSTFLFGIFYNFDFLNFMIIAD